MLKRAEIRQNKACFYGNMAENKTKCYIFMTKTRNIHGKGVDIIR